MRNTTRARSSRAGGSALIALALALPFAGACSSATDVVILGWEGELSATGPGGVSGLVAVVSQYGRTDASILIEGALPDTTYAWRINRGTCQDEGSIVGGAAVYGELTTNEQGSASREASIGGTLDRNSDYAARVMLPAQGGSVVACGELDRVR